jgi:hypothetical protein
VLTIFKRLDCHNYISIYIKDLTPVFYGQFIPAQSGQVHWHFPAICINGFYSTVSNPPDYDHDGYTEANGDCDDSNPNIHPNAVEILTEKMMIVMD